MDIRRADAKKILAKRLLVLIAFGYTVKITTKADNVGSTPETASTLLNAVSLYRQIDRQITGKPIAVWRLCI